MSELQQQFLILYSLGGIAGFLKAFHETKNKKNPFGITYFFRLYGAFVWGDMVIFGIFWTIAVLLSIILQDWLLFLLIVSLFWLVRSVGDSIYWFNQQFSTLNRNPIQNFKYLRLLFHNDSVWFVYQIFWQCMTVVFIITSLYLARLWLARIP